MDYTLAHTIKQIRSSEDPDDPDKFLTSSSSQFSYDIMCGYSLHAVERFSIHFPEMVSHIEKMHWLIPVVYVQNHKDNCMYLFSSAYIPGAGHKHRETTEMTWAEFNQLGPQTRQMNNGHRQDTIIDHFGDWNWKKTANMCMFSSSWYCFWKYWGHLLATSLFNDITHMKRLFVEKRDAFKALVETYHNRVATWNQKNWTLRVVKGGQVQCVYRQNQAKGRSYI